MEENPRRDKWIGTLLLGGVTLFLVGLGGWFILFYAGVHRMLFQGDGSLVALAPVMLGLCLIGLLMALSGLGWGLWLGRDRRAQAPEVRVEGAFVVAKYANDKRGNLLMYTDEFEPGSRCYVRLAMPDGKRVELRVDPELYVQVGEGLRGNVIIRGSWLEAFDLIRDAGPAPQAYRMD